MLIIIFLLFSILSGCLKNKEDLQIERADESKLPETTSSKTTENQVETNTSSTMVSITEGTNYLDFYEGLHITGTPIDVDINTYRLKISGAVDKEVSLSFNEIKNMESVREEIELVCPGFFVDKGYWTGIRVLDLLSMAGLNQNPERIKFINIDKSYSQILSMEKIKSEGFLIAYQFNGKEFSRYHGYPLRLVAKGEAGSYWVKWLGEIEALEK